MFQYGKAVERYGHFSIRPVHYGLATLVVFGAAVAVVSAPVLGAVIASGTAVVLSVVFNRFAWVAYFVSVSVTGLALPLGGASLRVEMLGLVFLLFGLTGQTRTKCARPVPGWVPICAATGYVGVLLVSSITQAPEPGRSLWILAQVVSGVSVGLAVAYKAVDLDAVVSAGTLVIGALSGVSVLGYVLVSIGAISAGSLGVASDGRLIGFSIETNIFAAQVVCWLAVVWCTRSVRTRVDVSLVCLMSVAVILAGTRSAWIAATFLVLLVIWSRTGRTLWLLPLGLAGAGAAAFAPVLGARLASTQPVESLGWRLGNVLNISEGTGAYRFNIYEIAISEIQMFPRWLIGSGMNSYSQFHLIDATNRAAEYLGNFALATLYDGGLLAFLALGGLLVSLAIAPPRKRPVVVLLAIVVCASVTNILWFQFTWLYLGLSVAHSLQIGTGGASGGQAISRKGDVYAGK